MVEPGLFTKGPVLRRLDEVVHDPTRRLAFLEALKYAHYKNLMQIFIDYGLPTDEQAAYLRKYWFNPNWADPNSGCLWPEHQPIEPVFRQGLIKAIELATPPAAGNAPAQFLPLNTCWVCAGTAFQMGICATDTQVNCIVLTPDLPEKEWARQRRPEMLAKLTYDGPFWVVKRGKESLEPWEVEQDKDDKTQVVTVRLQSRP